MKTKPAKNSGWQNKVYLLTLDGPLNDHSSAHKVWFQLHLWIAHSLKASGVNCFLKSSHIFHKVMQIQQLLYICSPKSEKWHSASSPSWNINSLLCIYCASRIWFLLLLLKDLGLFVLFYFVGFVLFFFFFFLFLSSWLHSFHINLCLQITNAVLLSSGFIPRKCFRILAEAVLSARRLFWWQLFSLSQLETSCSLATFSLLRECSLEAVSGIWDSFAGDWWTDPAFPTCWRTTSANSCATGKGVTTLLFLGVWLINVMWILFKTVWVQPKFQQEYLCTLHWALS